MEKRDARKLSPSAQEELRKRGIKMMKLGVTQRKVSEVLEVSRSCVQRWWLVYNKSGLKALSVDARGRPKGSGCRLNTEQERRIQRIITDKTPDQLKMDFALWDRSAVCELIRREYGVEYSLQNMSVLLKRWGFTPQKPAKLAYEQKPAEVKKWLDETYPAIKQRAQQENAEIFWADETTVKPEAHTRRSYAPKGKTPVIRQPAKRFHSSVISAINNRGKMQWMALSEAMNSELFIKFLTQMIKRRKRKIFLIVDNLRVHHSKVVKAWLEEHRDKIMVFFLPSYSPELNPDEYLNHNLKKNAFKFGVPPDKTILDCKVHARMLHLQKTPKIVASFFKHPNAVYAAA